MSFVFVRLFGGLGNQLFQYATARSIALHHNCHLLLDVQSGFSRDKHFKRSFELHQFTSLKVQPASWIQRSLYAFFYYFIKAFQRLSLQFPAFRSSIFFKAILSPLLLSVQPKIHFYVESFPTHYIKPSDVASSFLFLHGYFQSYANFSAYKSVICDELMPPPPRSIHLKSIGHQLRNTETLALGVRLYEECPDPSLLCFQGKVKPLPVLAQQLLLFLESHPSSNVAVFCTHRAEILDYLPLPTGRVTFLTGSDGVESAIDTLWLMSQCRHHLFLNSSLYWWGALLSEVIYGGPEKGQFICASNNYLNQGIYPPNWKRF